MSAHNDGPHDDAQLHDVQMSLAELLRQTRAELLTVATLLSQLRTEHDQLSDDVADLDGRVGSLEG
jgi:hypothetical protein